MAMYEVKDINELRELTQYYREARAGNRIIGMFLVFAASLFVVFASYFVGRAYENRENRAEVLAKLNMTSPRVTVLENLGVTVIPFGQVVAQER